jgi:[NiFe] hydrogenase assembly HybE family chaperone
MTTELPSPAPVLERRFDAILRTQMQGVPLLNPALRVQAVGFAPWGDHWLGVLVTPWFMNLVLMPRLRAAWQPAAERESRHHVFPAGVFEFIGGRDAELGDYQACSLFSPMFDFATQDGAIETAAAALQALFDAANRPAAAVPNNPAPGRTALTKREFLFASGARARDEP